MNFLLSTAAAVDLPASIALLYAGLARAPDISQAVDSIKGRGG
jgi:hypothetical protein